MTEPAVRRVLFLCTGNTCRSPLAEVIAREGARRRGLEIEFDSAGVAAMRGTAASEGSEIVAGQHGLDLRPHRAEQITAELARSVDLILAMDRSHRDIAAGLAPDTEVRLVTEYLQADDSRRGQPVPDPYGGWMEQYEETYDLLEASIVGFLDGLDRPDGSTAGS